jgi:cellulose synthase/poly-beta-1,6-N-acetylglucosamine synthase-like glycosyltransferase
MKNHEPPQEGFGESSAILRRDPLDLNPLSHRYPELSNARFYIWNSGVVICLTVFLAIIANAPSTYVISLGLFIFCSLQGFFYWVGLIMSLQRPSPTVIEADDDALLSMTLLFPVHDEANMMPQLAGVISTLDYPSSKCDIIILIEQNDLATRAAFHQLDWPNHVRLGIVPEGLPRTKPRACNYGLALATSSIIGIFDAEDRPHPKLLREVSARFSAGPTELACLQAPLAITHYNASPLAYLFAIEYAMQFTFLLPAWLACRAPTPLSGAGNFFRTDVLRKIGAWDPFNVTEDADLGIRLPRFGYRIEILKSPVYETAPSKFRDWFFQRTRWSTGHLQTLLVHLRNPVRFLRQVGALSMLLFFASFIARIFTPLAHIGLLIVFATDIGRLVPYLASTWLGWLSFFIYSGRIFCLLRLNALPDKPKLKRPLIFLILYHALQLPPLLLALYQTLTRNIRWYKTPHQPII